MRKINKEKADNAKKVLSNHSVKGTMSGYFAP